MSRHWIVVNHLAVGVEDGDVVYLERRVYYYLHCGGVGDDVCEDIHCHDCPQRVVASTAAGGVADVDVDRSDPFAVTGAVVVAYPADVGVVVCAGVQSPDVGHLYRVVNSGTAVRRRALEPKAGLERVMVGMGVPV